MKYDSLFFADAHLRDRRGDEFFALEQIVDAAIKHRVKRVIGAGDLLDKQTNRSRTVKVAQQQLQRLRDKHIGFLFVQGQHEFSDPPWLSGEGIHINKRTFVAGPYTGYGLDFQPFGSLQDALKEIPEDCDLLVAHQVWSDWMGDIAVPQGGFHEIPGHIGVVFTGDLHKKVIEKNKNLDGDKMLTLSPGATCMQKIDEPSEHFYFLVGEDGVFQAQRLKSRVFIDWPVINRIEDINKFMEEIEGELATAEQTAAGGDYPEDLLRPYLRVTYSHKLPDTVRRVTKVVGNRAILYWKELPPEEKTATAAVKKKAKGGEAVTPISVLPEVVNKEEKPEVFELTSRLLQAADSEMEFATWRKEFMGEE